MNYYNFFSVLSIVFVIVLPIISLIVFYYIVKIAVRNGVIEAGKIQNK